MAERPTPRITGRSTCPTCRAVFRRRLRRCPLDGSDLEPLPQDPLVGEIVGRRYAVERVIADGTAARRYLAIDERTGERCHLKIMYGDYASVDRHRRRFAREVEVGSRLCHPNVLAVIDAGETDGGVPFLVTVAVDGQPLAWIIEQHAPLSAARAGRLVADVAAGLAHIHERGFVHRGLTSDAVVVAHFRDAEAAIIADLGIACAPGRDTGDPMGRLTRAGKLVGAPAYMSPEQSIGGAVDPRSDLYSLGVLLYELLSGRPPFDGAAIAQASQHLVATPPRIVARVPGLQVDPNLEAIAMKLMQKDPKHRFPSADVLLGALGAHKIL